MFTRTITSVFVLAIVLAGCADSQREEAAETEAAIEQQTQEFITDSRSALEKVDLGIEELQAQLASAGEQTRASIQNSIVSLSTQRDKLRQDLSRLENSSESIYHERESVLAQRLRQIEVELETARLTAIEGRNEFELAAQACLADADEMLGVLKQQTEQAGSEADRTYSEALANLVQRRDELANQMKKMEGATEESFLEMKANLAASLASLEREVHDAVRDMDMAHLNETDSSDKRPATRPAS